MRTIKRYANRKLYDTQTGSYITLDDIAALIRIGEEIEVLDHASGRDLTTITLMQIVFEEEKRANSHIPRAVMTQVVQAGENLRSSFSPLLDPDSAFQAELQRRINRLHRRGQLMEAEVKRFLDLLLDPAVKIPDPQEIPADPTQVADLQKQVEELEKLIREYTA